MQSNCFGQNRAGLLTILIDGYDISNWCQNDVLAHLSHKSVVDQLRNLIPYF